MKMDETTQYATRRTGELVRTLYTHVGAVPVAGFKDWALGRLKTAVPFDSAFWAEGAEFGKTIFDAHLHNTRYPAEDWLADYVAIKDSDPLAEAVFANLGTTVSDIDIMSREAWLAHPAFGAFCRKHEIQYALCTAELDPISTLIEGLSIYRASPETPFSELERRCMQFLFPHLIEARRRNQLAEGQALAVCDTSGRLRFVDQRFLALLSADDPRWRGPHLPERLLPLVNGTTAAVRINGEGVMFRFCQRGEFTLFGLRSVSPFDRLTSKERQVAAALLAGDSYRSGADALGMAVSTFNKHASSLYKKLAVEGRAALVSRYGDEISGGAS